jgi:hypothetical protein
MRSYDDARCKRDEDRCRDHPRTDGPRSELLDRNHGFDQTLLQWRLASATAALRFIDTIIDQRNQTEPVLGSSAPMP